MKSLLPMWIFITSLSTVFTPAQCKERNYESSRTPIIFEKNVTIEEHFINSVQNSLSENKNFQDFVFQHVALPQRNGKLIIPENINHIKIDIGLSYSAPISQYWLQQESDLIVFGFEPNPNSVASIRNGAIKRHPSHGVTLDPKHVNVDFFLIPCALGLSKAKMVKFYITKEDCGCSSLYEPSYFEVENIIDVPVFSLSDFFDIFPFNTHPIVEYIKIDAQGSDLDIVKSAGSYLKDHVIYITIECENTYYKNTMNSEHDVESYMNQIGFQRHTTDDTDDPTYINSRYLEYVKENPIKIYQKG